MGKLVSRLIKENTLCNWLGVHVWLSPVVLGLEVGQTLWTLSVINQVPGIWSQFVTGVIVSLLRMVVRDYGLTSYKSDF